MSRYDESDIYAYPGTEVLRNKADIGEQLPARDAQVQL